MAATARKSKKKAPSVADVLAKTRVSAKPKAKKSSVPEVDNPDFYGDVDGFGKAKVAEKKAKALKEARRLVVLDKGLDERKSLLKTEGFVSSVKLLGSPVKGKGKRHTATVSVKAKYNAIPVDDEHASVLEAVESLTGDAYERYFHEETSVSLKSGVLADEEAMNELLEVLGAERFVRFFETRSVVSVTGAYHEEREIALDEETREALDALVGEPVKAVA